MFCWQMHCVCSLSSTSTNDVCISKFANNNGPIPRPSQFASSATSLRRRSYHPHSTRLLLQSPGLVVVLVVEALPVLQPVHKSSENLPSRLLNAPVLLLRFPLPTQRLRKSSSQTFLRMSMKLKSRFVAIFLARKRGHESNSCIIGLLQSDCWPCQGRPP